MMDMWLFSESKLRTKFDTIDYEGVTRRETFFFPKEAFRELLLNAVIHKDYMQTIPIQIQIYKDKIDIWNIGKMPDELRIEDLFKNIVPHQEILK